MICLLDVGLHSIHVDKTKINDIADLKERIEQEIKAINYVKVTLENVFDGIVKRLKFCIDVNSVTFEQ